MTHWHDEFCGQATWFDRTLCEDPCGMMHTRCVSHGKVIGTCLWEESVSDLSKQVAANAKREWNITPVHDGYGGKLSDAALYACNPEPDYGDEPYDAGKAAVKSAFKTKDSGQRKVFGTGMQRDTNEGKPRFDLITPADQPYDQIMTYRHAMLMSRGAVKYGDRNWEKARTAEELARFKESAYRHFMQWYHGEVDEDHAAAVYFNIAGVEYVKGRLA